MKIHKSAKGIYADNGIFDRREIPTPLCDGARGLYSGKSYRVHRMWAAVTCKKCLKKRVKK